MRIEAIFGGILAVFIVGLALIGMKSTQIGGPSGGLGADKITAVSTGGDSLTPVISSSTTSGSSGVCECFDDAFKLAGSNVGVMSAQYRTGFEQCRAVLGEQGGNAWTAGWNARLSAKPYASSCRAYLKKTG